MAEAYKTAQFNPNIPSNSTGNTGMTNTGTVPGYNSSAVTQQTVQYPGMAPHLQEMIKAPAHPMHPDSLGSRTFRQLQARPSSTNRQPEKLRQVQPGQKGTQMVHPSLKVEVKGPNGWLNTARTFAGRTLNSIGQGVYGTINFLGGTVPSLVTSAPGYLLQASGWGARQLGMEGVGDFLSRTGEQYHENNIIGNWYQRNVVDPNWAYLDNIDKANKAQFKWNDDWTDYEKSLADGTTEAAALAITGGAQATGRAAATTIGKGTRTVTNVARKIKGKAPKPTLPPQLKLPATTKNPTAPVKKFITNAGQERAGDVAINKVMGEDVPDNTAQPDAAPPVQPGHANQMPQQDMSGMAMMIPMMMMPMLMAGYNRQNVNNNQQQPIPTYNGPSQAMWRS